MRALAWSLVLVAAALLAACGAGTTVLVPHTSSPSASPGVEATAVATAAATMSASGSAAGLILGPTTTSGVSGVTVAFGATAANGFVVIGGWNGRPPNAPPLTAAIGPAPTALAYITISPSVNATFQTVPSLIVNLGSGAATTGNSYYVAYLPPGGAAWQQPLLGPATFNSSLQLNLPPNLNAGSWSVQTGSTYTYAIYSIPTPSFVDDWTSYAHDAQRTGYEQFAGSSPLGAVTPQNAPSLQLAWSNAPNPSCHDKAIAAQVVVDEASPLVANGFVYYADTCGYIAALNRETGAVAWSYQAPVQNQVDGVLGTPVLDGNKVIVPVWGDPGNCTNATLGNCDRANGGYLLALDAATGAFLWQTLPLALGNMRGEPFALNGLVYEGISGGDDTSGYVQGGLATYDENSGVQIGSMIQFASPASAYAPFDGGSSWTPITYDGTNLYVGTGNTRDDDGTDDGVVRLIPQPGAPPVLSSNYVISTFDNASADEDVGGGVLLYGGQLYFTGKNGYFYSYSLTNSSTPLVNNLINTNPSPAGRGGIGTPTTDGNVMTASSGYNVCPSNAACTQSDLDCFRVGSGTPFAKLQATNSAIFSYAAYASGVGFIGIDNGATNGTPTGASGAAPQFVAFDDSCKILWQANPVDVRGFFYGGPAVVASGVYAIDNAGNVYAWKLPYQMGQGASMKRSKRVLALPLTLLRSTHYTRRPWHP